MKRFIRLICCLMTFVMLATTPAYASEQSSRASSYIGVYRAYCTRTSATTLVVSVYVMGTSLMDEIGANKIKVQYSSDQVNWTTARTFTKDVYTRFVDYNTSAHAAEVTCVIPAGKYYRAYVEFYAAKDNGFAERYMYTDII